MLDAILGWIELGIISVFLFGEYPMPEKEDE